MNSARLGNKWAQAGGDPHRMAEALAEELNGPATGFLTRDFLAGELTKLKRELGRMFVVPHATGFIGLAMLILFT